MPAPLIGLAPAAISLVTRLAAKEGIKLTAKQAASIVARNPKVMQMVAQRPAGLKAATSGSGMPMAGMNQSALRMVMSNPHMQSMLGGLSLIPAGVATLLYNTTKEDEEPTLEGPITEEELIDTSKYGFPRMTEEEMRKEALIRREEMKDRQSGVGSLPGAAPSNFAGGGMVRRRVPDVYFQRYKDGGEAKSFPDLNNDGEITQADILKGRGVNFRDGGMVGGETHEEKIMRMERELMRMLNEGDDEMSDMFDEFNKPDAQTIIEKETIIQKDPFDGSDTTSGDDEFARQLFEMEKRKKMEEALRKLEPGQRLAHGGAVRGYNMGGAVMPQQRPQGIATMMTDPRTNMGNMPNQQQQQLAALQTTANAANLNANNLQKSMQAQQQQAMRGSVTAPISQVRIPSTKRRQFEDTLLNSRRRGQRAGQMAQRRASIPATIFG